MQLRTQHVYSIDEILDAFAVYDGTYRRQAVAAALANREAVAPKLIEVLEAVVAAPEAFTREDASYAPIYAVMLLGHWREPRAHPVLIALAGLPGELPHELLGDTVTENLAAILVRTCDGNVEAIKGLVQNRKADAFCRSAAASSLALGVLEGVLAREEAMEFLAGMLSEEWVEGTGVFLGSLASSLCDLFPAECLEALTTAHRQGWIDPRFIGLDSIHRAIAKGKEQCLLDFKEQSHLRSLDDIHASMSWWACFRPEPQRAQPQPSKNKAKRDRRKGAKKPRKK